MSRKVSVNIDHDLYIYLVVAIGSGTDMILCLINL
jgi:pantothenate kinase